MKKIILSILRTGYTTTKKYTVEDICRKLFLLRDLIEYDELTGLIKCNNNPFWSRENEERRTALYWDISMVSRFNIMDSAYFTILNRHANGDAYGIQPMSRAA